MTQIKKNLRKEAIKKINFHKKCGHTIVVISASMESWLKKWCDQQSVDLIATKLEIKNSKLTGKFLTKNCHGKEKVLRLKKNMISVVFKPSMPMAIAQATRKCWR